MAQQFLLPRRRQRNATSLHEANFKKLARVVPNLHTVEDALCVGGLNNTRLTLRILESSKYTKTFSLQLQQCRSQSWLPELHMKIRNYYDAGVTEVLAFQQQHRLTARYSYPNPRMFQRNEKWQTNHFLGEWLDHCLRTHCVFRDEIGSFDR